MGTDHGPPAELPTPRPLPSVDIPLLPEERRAVRARQVAAAAAVLAVAVGAIAAAYVVLRGPAGADAPAAEPSRTRPGRPAEPRSDAPRSATGVGVTDGGLAVGTPPPAATPASPGADGGDAATPVLATFAADAAAHAEPPLPPAPLPDAVEPMRVTHPFGRARSFHGALLAASLSDAEASAIEAALTPLVDFRHCQPEDVLVVERSRGGDLAAFEYRSGRLAYARAERAGDGFRARRVEVPVQRTTLRRGARVTTSLGEAFERLGLGRALVGAFVGIFEGRINFATDVRTGDTFKLLVEEQRIDGEVVGYGPLQAVEYIGQRTGRLRALWFEASGGDGDYYDEQGRALHGGWLRTPVRYDRISSRFNPRRLHPILRRVVPHTGVDYTAPTGTPIRAAAAGTVSFAGEKGPNGNLVSIRHEGGYETFYAHLLRIERAMRRGAAVSQGQVVGYLGSTGRSTGPHLHFALKKHGRFVDPLEEINGAGRMLQARYLGRFRPHAGRLLAELDRVTVPSLPAPSGPGAAMSGDEIDDPMD